MTSTRTAFNRQTEIGDIAVAVRRLTQRGLLPLAILAIVETAILGMRSDPGTNAFALIAVGNLLILAVWSSRGVGLPIVPLMGIQNLLIYGLPIVTRNETIAHYTESIMTLAGWEVLIFSLAMIGAWSVGMQFVPKSSRWCYALEGMDENSRKLARLGVAMVTGSTLYKLLESVGLLWTLLDLLPRGSGSILTVLVTAISGCGFFLGGMMIGKGSFTPFQKTGFWVMLTIQAYIAASGFLLSATIIVAFSVVTGIFWGSGKLPWRFIGIVVLVLSFLNLGKFEMREKYWSPDEEGATPGLTLLDTPRTYTEWFTASWNSLTGNAVEEETSFSTLANSSDGKDDSGQSMLERINNLQNILFVIDVIQSGNAQPLGGETYKLIPPLFVPRILWPDKPRTHLGQILLNVHFGRQDAQATYRTYIAWGLLPEAYGNFGPITGAIVLGIFMGLVFAWLEKAVAAKLVMSAEGLLSFTLFVGLANSFEMVASVLLTSLFQAVIPVLLATAPFVHRRLPKQPQ